MGIKLFAAAAVALCPVAVLAQNSAPKPDSSPPPTAARADSTPRVSAPSASSGDVSKGAAPVTGTMLKAQEDPALVGSPAWWRTHATADGKPKRS